jgi:hypothetical protein
VALAFLLLLVLRKRLGSVGSTVVSVALAAGFIAFGVTGGRAISAQGGADRLELWRSGIDILKTRPLFGVGMGNFSDYSPTHHTAHNSFVLCFSELGLTGYFVWLAMLIATFAALRWLRQQQSISSPGRITLVAAAAASVHVSSSAALTTRIVPEDGTAEGGTGPEAVSQIVRTANVLWYALVAFLTAGFFLSRAYSMTLYILLGVAAALQVIVNAQRSSPETRARMNPVSLRWLCATTLGLEFASIVVIYVMVRLGGA